MGTRLSLNRIRNKPSCVSSPPIVVECTASQQSTDSQEGTEVWVVLSNQFRRGDDHQVIRVMESTSTQLITEEKSFGMGQSVLVVHTSNKAPVQASLSEGRDVVVMSEICNTAATTDSPLEKSTAATTDSPLEKSTAATTDSPLEKSTTATTDSPLEKSTAATTDSPLKESTTVQEVRQSTEKSGVTSNVPHSQPTTPSVSNTQTNSPVSKNEVYKQKEIIDRENNKFAGKTYKFLKELIIIRDEQTTNNQPGMANASTQSSQEPTNQSTTPSDEQSEREGQQVPVKTVRKRRRRKRKKHPSPKKNEVGKATQPATQPLHTSKAEKKRKNRKNKRKLAEPGVSLCRGEMKKAGSGLSKQDSSSSSSDSECSSEFIEGAKQSSSSLSSSNASGNESAEKPATEPTHKLTHAINPGLASTESQEDFDGRTGENEVKTKETSASCLPGSLEQDHKQLEKQTVPSPQLFSSQKSIGDVTSDVPSSGNPHICQQPVLFLNPKPPLRSPPRSETYPRITPISFIGAYHGPGPGMCSPPPPLTQEMKDAVVTRVDHTDLVIIGEPRDEVAGSLLCIWQWISVSATERELLCLFIGFFQRRKADSVGFGFNITDATQIQVNRNGVAYISQRIISRVTNLTFVRVIASFVRCFFDSHQNHVVCTQSVRHLRLFCDNYGDCEDVDVVLLQLGAVFLKPCIS